MKQIQSIPSTPSLTRKISWVTGNIGTVACDCARLIRHLPQPARADIIDANVSSSVYKTLFDELPERTQEERQFKNLLREFEPLTGTLTEEQTQKLLLIMVDSQQNITDANRLLGRLLKNIRGEEIGCRTSSVPTPKELYTSTEIADRLKLDLKNARDVCRGRLLHPDLVEESIKMQEAAIKLVHPYILTDTKMSEEATAALSEAITHAYTDPYSSRSGISLQDFYQQKNKAMSKTTEKLKNLTPVFKVSL